MLFHSFETEKQEFTNDDPLCYSCEADRRPRTNLSRFLPNDAQRSLTNNAQIRSSNNDQSYLLHSEQKFLPYDFRGFLSGNDCISRSNNIQRLQPHEGKIKFPLNNEQKPFLYEAQRYQPYHVQKSRPGIDYRFRPKNEQRTGPNDDKITSPSNNEPHLYDAQQFLSNNDQRFLPSIDYISCPNNVRRPQFNGEQIIPLSNNVQRSIPKDEQIKFLNNKQGPLFHSVQRFLPDNVWNNLPGIDHKALTDDVQMFIQTDEQRSLKDNSQTSLLPSSQRFLLDNVQRFLPGNDHRYFSNSVRETFPNDGHRSFSNDRQSLLPNDVRRSLSNDEQINYCSSSIATVERLQVYLDQFANLRISSENYPSKSNDNHSFGNLVQMKPCHSPLASGFCQLAEYNRVCYSSFANYNWPPTNSCGPANYSNPASNRTPITSTCYSSASSCISVSSCSPNNQSNHVSYHNPTNYWHPENCCNLFEKCCRPVNHNDHFSSNSYINQSKTERINNPESDNFSIDYSFSNNFMVSSDGFIREISYKKLSVDRDHMINSDENMSAKKHHVVNSDENVFVEKHHVINSIKNVSVKKHRVKSSDKQLSVKKHHEVKSDKKLPVKRHHKVNSDKKLPVKRRLVVNSDKKFPGEKHHVVNSGTKLSVESYHKVHSDENMSVEKRRVVNSNHTSLSSSNSVPCPSLSSSNTVPCPSLSSSNTLPYPSLSSTNTVTFPTFQSLANYPFVEEVNSQNRVTIDSSQNVSMKLKNNLMRRWMLQNSVNLNANKIYPNQSNSTINSVSMFFNTHVSQSPSSVLPSTSTSSTSKEGKCDLPILLNDTKAIDVSPLSVTVTSAGMSNAVSRQSDLSASVPILSELLSAPCHGSVNTAIRLPVSCESNTSNDLPILRINVPSAVNNSSLPAASAPNTVKNLPISDENVLTNSLIVSTDIMSKTVHCLSAENVPNTIHNLSVSADEVPKMVNHLLITGKNMSNTVNTSPLLSHDALNTVHSVPAGSTLYTVSSLPTLYKSANNIANILPVSSHCVSSTVNSLPISTNSMSNTVQCLSVAKNMPNTVHNLSLSPHTVSNTASSLPVSAVEMKNKVSGSSAHLPSSGVSFNSANTSVPSTANISLPFLKNAFLNIDDISSIPITTFYTRHADCDCLRNILREKQSGYPSRGAGSSCIAFISSRSFLGCAVGKLADKCPSHVVITNRYASNGCLSSIEESIDELIPRTIVFLQLGDVDLFHYYSDEETWQTKFEDAVRKISAKNMYLFVSFLMSAKEIKLIWHSHVQSFNEYLNHLCQRLNVRFLNILSTFWTTSKYFRVPNNRLSYAGENKLANLWRDELTPLIPTLRRNPQ